jgi:hypothetical protein
MERRKFVIGMGSLAAGGAAAMGTGAFTAAEVSGRSIGVQVTDDSQSLIALNVGEGGTTDNYVSYNNGELVIDFENDGSNANNGDSAAGVNPNSKYQLGDVPQDLDSETALDGTEPLEIGSIQSNHAFSIANQSQSTQDIEVEVDMDDVPENLSLYLIAQNQAPSPVGPDNEEALVAGAATPNNNWNTVLSFTSDSSGALQTGGEILVSLLIERGSQDADQANSEWSGNMSVSAGETDDVLNETELTNNTNVGGT